MTRKMGTASHEIIWLIVKIGVIGASARFTRSPFEWVVIGVILWWIIRQIELWSEKRYSKTHLEEAVDTRLRVDKQMGREPDAVERLVAQMPKPEAVAEFSRN